MKLQTSEQEITAYQFFNDEFVMICISGPTSY